MRKSCSLLLLDSNINDYFYIKTPMGYTEGYIVPLITALKVLGQVFRGDLGKKLCPDFPQGKGSCLSSYT